MRMSSISSCKKRGEETALFFGHLYIEHFTGTQAQFSQQTLDNASGNPDLIAIDIDAIHRYISIGRGSDVPLTKSQISDASNAFVSYFHTHNGDYTGASIAAIDSLLNSFSNI